MVLIRGQTMWFEERYAIERVKDRLWVVIDKTREGPPIGRSGDETGARMIVSLLSRFRRGSKDREGAGHVPGQRVA